MKTWAWITSFSWSVLLLLLFCLIPFPDLISGKKLKSQGQRAKKKLAKMARKRSGDTTTKMPKPLKEYNRVCSKKVLHDKTDVCPVRALQVL